MRISCPASLWEKCFTFNLYLFLLKLAWNMKVCANWTVDQYNQSGISTWSLLGSLEPTHLHSCAATSNQLCAQACEANLIPLSCCCTYLLVSTARCSSKSSCKWECWGSTQDLCWQEGEIRTLVLQLIWEFCTESFWSCPLLTRATFQPRLQAVATDRFWQLLRLKLEYFYHPDQLSLQRHHLSYM